MLTEPNTLLTLAIVLAAGLGSGAVAQRVHLPAVTGQIVIGVLLGPWVFSLLDAQAIHGVQPITHFALGLIGVAVGSHLHIRRLRNAFRRLSLLLALEVSLTPLLVFLGLILLPDTTWTLSSLLAMLAVSTAPATIVAVVKETRSKGIFVKTLLPAVALNNIACICLFELVHTAARAGFDPHVQGVAVALASLVAPFKQLVGAAVLGGGAGLLLIAATWRVVLPDRLASASIIAILITAGLADHLGVSALLSCMFLGVTLANVTPDKDEIGHGVFANFENAILAAFFTLAGMELDFRYAIPGGVLAIIVVAARAIGKVSAARIAMRLAGATERMRKYLGMALIPQAGVAIGLILVIKEDPAFTSIASLFLAVGLTSVLLNELAGPILTRIALRHSGDLGKDRARLIDFLHEENITTELPERTKEGAITALVDLLIQSHHLNIDRAEFLKSVLDREQQGSTCVGEGLMIPHGRLPEGGAIVGAMAISHDGLDLDAHDEQPVHCIVLLATPPNERDRHLEVLAALARAIGSDRNIQRQLYGAKSPAHAYEILHAEEFEDFNYFLDEEERV